MVGLAVRVMCLFAVCFLLGLLVDVQVHGCGTYSLEMASLAALAALQPRRSIKVRNSYNKKTWLYEAAFSSIDWPCLCLNIL